MLRARRMPSATLHLENLESRELLTLYGNAVFPSDNPWNQRIDKAPVATNSATLVASVGLNATVVPDFGSGLWEGAAIGIPFNVVTKEQPLVQVIVDAYPDESDLISVPIPDNAVIEGDPLPSHLNTGDRHLLVYDRDNNVLYEAFNVRRPSETADGQWHADSLAFWDLTRNYFRPPTWTSADAAGLPIVPGLVRPEEITEKGRIEHPIRVTVPRSRNQYVFPASHHAGSNNAALPRMGERFRLRQDFDLSTYSPTNQIILQAMKEYGLIVADNGSPWFISGIPSDFWKNDELRQLRRVRGSDFEAIDLSPQLTMLDVTTGPTVGGFPVTIDGLNFGGAAGQFQVYFGAKPAPEVAIQSSGQVIVTAPAHPEGTVQVTIQTPYGRSAPTAKGLFTFANTGPQPGRLRFGTFTHVAGEADAFALVSVLRTGGSDGPVSVHYAAAGGSATAGTDFTAVSGRLSFAAGESLKMIQIPLREDSEVEGRETILLTLANPSGGAALETPASATLIVRDNDADPHGRFVTQLYRDLLGRPTDELGYAGWTTLLGQGFAPGEVSRSVAASAEYRTGLVRNAYRHLLGRDPDPLGLNHWATMLNNGGTELELQAKLYGSAEFFALQGSSTARFLDAVYTLALGRGVDPGGASGWTQAMTQGQTRGQVAAAVLRSDESLQRDVRSLYATLLNRAADASGLVAFTTALRQGTRRESVVATIAGSAEYVNSCI